MVLGWALNSKPHIWPLTLVYSWDQELNSYPGHPAAACGASGALECAERRCSPQGHLGTAPRRLLLGLTPKRRHTLCSISPDILSPLPDLDLCQEVDGLWESHQTVLVQDEFLQLWAPVKTGPDRALGDRVLQSGPEEKSLPSLRARHPHDPVVFWLF